MQKIEFQANDKKVGMTLAELKTNVDRALGLAETNGTNPNDSKVTVLINWGGSLKSLWAEV